MADETKIDTVVTLLPSDAATSYEWDRVKIAKVMDDNNFGVSRTVRFYWLERVNDTAEYLNIGNKELLTLHQNARKMLEYWDSVIAANGDTGNIDTSGVNCGGPMKYAPITRPWAVDKR